MPTLESMYRRLLLTYPREYRREHEEEILATLVDASEPGRRRPSLRETCGLLAGGLRTRAILAAREGGRALCADGLRLGVALLLAIRIKNYTMWFPGIPSIDGTSVPMPLTMWVAPVVLTLALVAVLRGGARSSLALVLLGGVASTSLSIQPPTLLDLVSPTAPLLSSSSLLITLAAALLAAQWSTQRTRRPWPLWIAAALVAAPVLSRWVLGWLPIPAPYLTVVSVAGLVVPWALLVALALIGRDPRPSIAATVYAAAALLPTAFLMVAYGWLDRSWELVIPSALLIVGIITTAATMPRGNRLVRG